MEKAKRVRTANRSSFTKALNALNAVIGTGTDANRAEVSVALQMLEDKMQALDISSREFVNLLFDDAATSDVEIQKEYDEMDEYKSKFIAAKIRIMEYTNSTVNQVSSGVTSITQMNNCKSYKLPKIELAKFSGDVREWLQFWSLFKKIHEDGSMTKEDKFQYLIQGMVTGSRAAELVRSYPPTAANYDKVIASLKGRFGREDLQIEVYVRELLQLVLQNAVKPNKCLPIVSLYDQIESHLRALDSLGVTTDKCAAMLFPLVESSLPEDILRAWQRSSVHQAAMQNNNDSSMESKNRLTQLIKFLEGEVQNELRISMAVKGFNLKTDDTDGEKPKKSKLRTENKDLPSATGLLTVKAKVNSCLFCNSDSHGSASCEMAKKMSLSERQECARKKHACFNCLKIGHQCKQCRVKLSCSWCTRRHLLLMCPNIGKKDNKTESKAENKSESKDNDSSKDDCNLANFSSDPEVLMQTLSVKLRNENKEIVIRALIDSGSQKSYIAKWAAEEMSYTPIEEQPLTHVLFGGQKSNMVRHKKYRVRLSCLDDSYRCNFVAFDQDVICESVPLIRDRVTIDELKRFNIKVNDINSKQNSIAMLIGADVAGKLYTGQRHVLSNGLVAFETFLGWVVMGKVPRTEKREDAAVMAISMFVKEDDISQLWSLDILGIGDPIERKSQREREEEMLSSFLETVKINEQGRYEVKLPWLQSHPALTDNKELAFRRLQSVVRKLNTDNLFVEYNNVFQEWLDEGIIEYVDENEQNNWGCYLPHRPVVKEGSTTRVRPVFDASAKGQLSPSLNECLHVGPNLIELITTVLLRFREGKFGVISDIKKAFLQISLDQNDRDFLRFLWFDDTDNVIILRHCRVVFGVASSPFILSSVINMHLNKVAESMKCTESPDFSLHNIRKLSRSFYVDNCVTSMNTKQELDEFITDARGVMSPVGFDLRGWEYTGDDLPEHQAAVLGLKWNKRADTLSLNVPDFSVLTEEKITKRKVLSCAHRIFDPLGFICPIMLGPRMLLQETWNENLKWDDELPEGLRDKFLKWTKDLTNLRDVKVPRCFVGQVSENDDVTLHTFCDASKYAYATVVFLRVENSNGVKVNFVQAKTRVAPMKKIDKDARSSIPRLELLAATIGARLTITVMESLDFEIRNVFYWTDSSTVLAWIKRRGNWATFVSNRVEEIRKLSDPEDWRHVQGPLNPADLPSRGCTVKQLLSSEWWQGPSWLYDVHANWPISKVMCDESEIKGELRRSMKSKESVCAHVILKNVESFYSKFSSFKKAVRVFGWVQRFICNIKNKKELRVYGNLEFQEIQKSRALLLKVIQVESFPDASDTRIKHLNPFVDDDGMIRLNSKISLRDDVYSFRCPLILPGKHHLVELIIKEKHEDLKHAGVEITINALREEFWILGGRRVIRSIVKRCVSCRRHDSVPFESINVPLPLDRVRDAAIFEVVGVDFAGPVYLKGGQKAWICIYTCAVFRAVHCELVSSLSTASFLMSIRRFIARRGRPSIIYSDNGTNFVGLNNMLKTVDFDRLTKTLALEQIEWKFNPPTAAWWGGFWERLIGILKRLLRRTLKKSCLNYEEMLTVLLDCEAVINSRPITFLSESDHEFAPLTPSMFLQDIREIGVLDLDKIEKCDFSKRYLYRQKIKEDLRCRFRAEYLGALIYRKGVNKDVKRVNVGDIVLIGSENSKRIDWPLARVKELIHGKDNHVRVVRLVSKNGELIRPIQRIYPLELKYDETISTTDGIVTDRYKHVNNPDNVYKERPKTSESENKSLNDRTYITRTGRESRKPERLHYT